jgi:hypothetical protein
MTNFRELSPSWEAANCTATEELPSNLWNPTVHLLVHKSSPLVPILSQIDPVHITPPYFSKIHFNIIHHLRFGLPSDLFPYGFPTNTPYAILIAPFVLHALTISPPPPLLDQSKLYLAKSASYETPHHAVFSNLPSLHLSSVQIFSLAPCCQTP